MSALRDIIKLHGGSFDRAPNKASFWMPADLCTGSDAEIGKLHAILDTMGKRAKFVRDENGWRLYRFVGERDTSCRTFRCFDVGATNNVNPHLTMVVFKNGLVEIREKGRKQGVSTTVCEIYIQCLLGIVRRKNLEKARAKKAKKKARR